MRSGQYVLGRQGARRLLIPGIVLGLALASCNANPEPAPLPTEGVSSSTTTTPSPSQPTAPTMPAEAQGKGKAATKAFVRHYIDLVNHAMSTGDTSQLSTVNSSECGTCTAIVGRIDEVYGAGGRLEGSGWRVRSLSTLPSGTADVELVTASIAISAQAAYLGNDASPRHSPASRGSLDFHLSRVNDRWLVVRLDATQ